MLTREIAWNLNRTVAPVIPVVPVVELKDHLRVTHADEDEQIEAWGLTADTVIEKELARAFLTQTWVLRLDRFPCWDIPLPRPLLQSVTSVQYIDVDGATQALATSEYTVDTFSFPGRIHLAYGKSWPSTRAVPNAVTVTYKAGKDTIEDVSELVRMAIKMTVAELYRQREVSAEEAVQQIPIYERLLANERCVAEFVYA